MTSFIALGMRLEGNAPPPKKKLSKNIWFVLYDNDPALQSILVNDSLAKNYVTAREDLPYSSDLASVDSYLFFLLKSAYKGWHLCSATDIVKNVT